MILRLSFWISCNEVCEHTNAANMLDPTAVLVDQA